MRAIALDGVPDVAIAAPQMEPGWAYFGRVTAGGQFSQANEVRVWLDGTEVTHDCLWADDLQGELELFLRDRYGERYLKANGDTATVVKGGRVHMTAVPRRDSYGHTQADYDALVRR